jgi:hypothetical protein
MLWLKQFCKTLYLFMGQGKGYVTQGRTAIAVKVLSNFQGRKGCYDLVLLIIGKLLPVYNAHALECVYAHA